MASSTGDASAGTWATEFGPTSEPAPPTRIDPGPPTPRALEPYLSFQLRPPMPDDSALGQKVAVVGDMTGDGLSEIVVDDHRDPDVPGQVYVIFGKPDMTDVALDKIEQGQGGFIVLGETGAGPLPTSIADAGDVNGDGTPDLLFGNTNVHLFGSQTGSGYVVWGKPDGSPVPLDAVVSGIGGFVMRGAMARDDVGECVAGGSDIDLDGFDDVLIGGPGADVDGENYGGAYVVFGGRGGAAVELGEIDESDRGFSIQGHAFGGAGASLDMPGDLDGDGWPDLVIGASQESAVGTKSGRAYVVFGRPQLKTMSLADVLSGEARGFIVESTGAFDSAGAQVRGLGDVNGDGLPDLYVTSGAWGHVVFGKADPDTVYLGDLGEHGFRVHHDKFLDGGLIAAPMGDVDGDELADFVLGGFGAPMILVLGKTDTDPLLASAVRNGTVKGAIIEAEGEAFGWGFDGGGDIDGDGWPDLVVGQPSWFETPAWGYVYGF